MEEITQSSGFDMLSVRRKREIGANSGTVGWSILDDQAFEID